MEIGWNNNRSISIEKLKHLLIHNKQKKKIITLKTILLKMKRNPI